MAYSAVVTSICSWSVTPYVLLLDILDISVRAVMKNSGKCDYYCRTLIFNRNCTRILYKLTYEFGRRLIVDNLTSRPPQFLGSASSTPEELGNQYGANLVRDKGAPLTKAPHLSSSIPNMTLCADHDQWHSQSDSARGCQAPRAAPCLATRNCWRRRSSIQSTLILLIVNLGPGPCPVCVRVRQRHGLMRPLLH